MEIYCKKISLCLPGIPPLAVTCKNVEKKEFFKERHKDLYRYEVNGGLHSVKARQGLVNENPIFSTVQAVVYVGLSDEEALRLASRHNTNGHFNHRMTHRDYVSHSIRTHFFINIDSMCSFGW